MNVSGISLETCGKSLLAGLCLGYFLGYLLKRNNNKVPEINDVVKSTKLKDTKPTHTVALIVNSSLKMKKGKIAAQCGHAMYGLYKKAKKKTKKSLEEWIEDGQDIMCVSVQSADDFDDLAQMAMMESLEYYVVADAGRTQVKSGSLTVMGIGPSHYDNIQRVVGQLPLYL